MPMPCAIASRGVGEDDRLAVEQDAPGGRPSTPAIIFTSVDLPAPFSPTRTLTAPRRTAKSALLDGDGAGIDLGHPFEAQDDVGFVLSGGGVGHGLGPIVISTGVTSGGSPAASSA